MFLINRGEITLRLDAQFYAENFDFKNFVKLGDFVKVKGGKRIPKGLSYSDIETDFWYLRVDDIDDYGNINFQKMKYISDEIFDTLKNYELRKNEIVISNAGTIGKIALLEDELVKKIVLTENCAKLKITVDSLLPKFLKIILSLSIVQKQMTLAYIQTTIPKLALERIYNLKIPKIPSLEIQTEIISIFETAYNAKKQKETEAADLLASIDGYLLNELGITLPPPSDKKTYFMSNSKQVSGGRFDPFYHQDEFEKLEQALLGGKYGIEKLGTLLAQINYGASVKNEYADTGIPFLRISDLNRNEINVKEMKFLPKNMQKDLGNAFVYENDFLISRSGTLGVVALATKEINGFAYGSFMIKFCLKQDAPVNKKFISYFLNSETMQKIVGKNKIGAIQGNITIPTIKNLQIPLPPLEKQTEIADHIRAIRAKAKQLQHEAKAELEQAKKTIEKMILGEQYE